MSFLKTPSAAFPPSRPSFNSPQAGTKRPRPDGSTLVYSQPENTNSGLETMTRVTFALDYLKDNEKAMTFEDIFKYLSIQEPGGPGVKPRPAPKGGRDWKLLTTILQRHDKVEYNPSGFKGEGSYRYRPKHNVRSTEQLKGLLQRQTSSVGIKASELKDGWPGAVDAINELDSKGEVLVTRNQKTGQPLLVWQNDPSLCHGLDAEFRGMFLGIALPANPEDMRSRLEAAGLKPVSAPKDVKAVPTQVRKKRGPRKGLKTTNTHMLNVFRDYSGRKR